ncbi:hypothetical protein [Vibrio vulnificus]|uniref:hypothetical protein n=1 Tax=Vibrio vulnificus TaxID=672 RepID=UPI00165D87A7|nr:hypothetical protein [Vibrio vulnificus]
MTEPCMSNDSGHYQGSYSERTECGVIGAYNKYTAFDALKKNAGIVSIKLSGICPGASCEEGGLDPYKKIGVPVPVGDRGPSCPQCRFWITGPMFLLGQVVEGNQLIRKIKKKVIAIDKIRESIIDAEDNGNTQLYTEST